MVSVSRAVIRAILFVVRLTRHNMPPPNSRYEAT